MKNYTVGQYKGKVVYLNFAKQSLYQFPNMVLFSPQLKGVNVNDNHISVLPSGLRYSKNLSIIKAKNNQLSEQLFSALPPKLVWLDVANNQIKELPTEVFSLKRLEYLNVSGNTIDSLPSAIGNLKKLEYLNCSNTGVIYVSEELCSLRKLRRLNVKGNPNVELPLCLLSNEKLVIQQD